MSSLQLDIRTTIGAVFVGLVAGSIFYGVTILQTILYFQTYPEDLLSLRCLVGFIWALDTVSLILITHAVWTWLVVGFANPFSLINIPSTMKVEPMITATLALFVHLFMAHRIKILDPRRRTNIIAGVIAVLSLFPWTMAILAVYYGYTIPGGFAKINEKLPWVTICANTSTAVLDIAILVTLCTQLHTSQKDFPMKRTSRIIHMLTIYLVANNLLTSFVTVSGLIAFFAAPDDLIYLALHIMVSKAYANTFMAQLNARQSIRRRVQDTALQVSGLRIETDTQVLRSRDPKETFGMDSYYTKHAQAPMTV